MEHVQEWIGYVLAGAIGVLGTVATGLLKEVVKDLYTWAKFKLIPSARPPTLVERTYEPRGASALRCSWVPEAKMRGAKERGYGVYLDPEMKSRVYREAARPASSDEPHRRPARYLAVIGQEARLVVEPASRGVLSLRHAVQ